MSSSHEEDKQEMDNIATTTPTTIANIIQATAPNQRLRREANRRAVFTSVMRLGGRTSSPLIYLDIVPDLFNLRLVNKAMFCLLLESLRDMVDVVVQEQERLRQWHNPSTTRRIQDPFYCSLQ